MTPDEIVKNIILIVLTLLLMVISEHESTLDKLSKKFNVSKVFFIFWGAINCTCLDWYL